MPSTRSARLIYVLIIGIAIVMIGRNLYHRHLNNSLIVAVKARNVAEVHALLNRGADPNTKEHVDEGRGYVREDYMLDLLDLRFNDGKGTSSSNNTQDIACLLIEHGEKISNDPKDPSQYLEQACSIGAVRIVRCLLQHGANASFESSDHYGPMAATVSFIQYGNFQFAPAQHVKEYNHRRVVGMEIIGLLEQKGAHLTPWQAIRINDMASLRAALDKGIDVEAQEVVARNQKGSDKGKTLLQEAVENKNREAVLILLQHSAAINAVNKTDKLTGDPYSSLLSRAIYLQDKEMFHLLLAHGADVNAGQNENNSPMIAAIRNMPEVVPELLQHGADLKQQGVPALRDAIKAKGDQLAPRPAWLGKSPNTKKAPPSLDVVALLLHKGVRCQGPAGHSLLLAALQYRPDLVPVFLTQGTSGRETPQEHDSLLWSAVHFDRAQLVMPLLQAGANINATHGDSTPLLEAIGHDPALVKLLLDKGADPAKVVGLSPTPLGMAALSGNLEAAKHSCNMGPMSTRRVS